MKLNEKGYMLVEIIIASVLAMSIAYYLLNLTYKFKNTNEDLYQSYNYMRDKILITKNIMNDLEKGTISGLYRVNNNLLLFELNDNSRMLYISKTNGKTKLQYGKRTSNGNFDESDLSYYEKELDASLIIENLSIDGLETESDSVTIEIPIKSIYSDEIYTIKLFANKQ